MTIIILKEKMKIYKLWNIYTFVYIKCSWKRIESVAKINPIIWLFNDITFGNYIENNEKIKKQWN